MPSPSYPQIVGPYFCTFSRHTDKFPSVSVSGGLLKCTVKPLDGDILKLRGLGQGDSGVQPRISGMYPTHGLYLS
jgi:hypothetical protein